MAAWCNIDFGSPHGRPFDYSGGGNLYLNNTLVADLVIPDEVKEIKKYAFYNCKSITSVKIPDSVTSIGSYAFYGTAYYKNDNNWENGVLYNGKYLINAKTSISGDYIIKPGTKVISDDAFYKCSSLESVTIPDSVTSIGYGAFEDCSKLSNVTIPDSVTSIVSYAFFDCSSLSSVTIPDSVTTIGSYAFTYCSSLKDVYYNGTKAQWEKISISSYNDYLKNATIHYIDTTKPVGSISDCTNLVAGNQTVTMTLSDNKGIAGFYWGTNSNYLNNSFTTTSSTSVTKAVSASGTYYLTVKDTSGNLSDTVSITFYKTTLNANGGSISTTTVLTKSGNSFTPPTPTKTGYTCIGWATSSTATSGKSSITVNNSSTYYAVWDKNDKEKPIGSISSTNNVASSQTVTISLSDNDGVVGYYWGTDATYSSNEYFETSNATETKDISAAGTYYLTVKDKNGNLSNTVSITFYKTTLNPNGGDCEISSVLTKSGDNFTFPVPVKDGFSYNGWSKNSSDTIGIMTLTVSENSTYFALWGTKNNWDISRQYWFSNSRTSFPTGKYTMTDNDFDKLCNYVKKYYSKSTANSIINNLRAERNSNWGGSCYGMSTTAILDYLNKIGMNENFDSDAPTIHQVDSPSTNPAVQSAINYYQISQLINFTRENNYYADKSSNTWKPTLKALVQKAQKGDIMLFCYTFWAGGHAIVVKGYNGVDANGNHLVVAYDNRYPNRDIIVKVSSDYSTCTVNENENATRIEFTSDFSSLDKIDIDGPNNDMILSDNSEIKTSGTQISVVVNGYIHIENESGQTLDISDGVISGTMAVLSEHFIVHSNDDGTPAPVELILGVADSDYFTFDSSTGNISASVLSEKMYADVDSTNAMSIVISQTDGITVLGDNAKYETNLSVGENDVDMIYFSGTSNGNSKVFYNNGNVYVTGNQPDNNNFGVYSSNGDFEQINFASQKASISIDIKPSKIAYGDLDGKEGITSFDSLLVLQNSIKKIAFTEEQKLVADVDGDGKVTSFDSLLILQYSIKKITKFPVEG